MILPPAIAGTHHTDKDEDKGPDVIRIRLWNASNCIAVLSDFYSADRVLANWALNGTRSDVRFEVTFADDLVLQGAYEFFSKGKRRCTFGRHLQQLVRSSHDAEIFSPNPCTYDARLVTSPGC